MSNAQKHLAPAAWAKEPWFSAVGWGDGWGLVKSSKGERWWLGMTTWHDSCSEMKQVKRGFLPTPGSCNRFIQLMYQWNSSDADSYSDESYYD